MGHWQAWLLRYEWEKGTCRVLGCCGCRRRVNARARHRRRIPRLAGLAHPVNENNCGVADPAEGDARQLPQLRLRVRVIPIVKQYSVLACGSPDYGLCGAWSPCDCRHLDDKGSVEAIDSLSTGVAVPPVGPGWGVDLEKRFRSRFRSKEFDLV